MTSNECFDIDAVGPPGAKKYVVSENLRRISTTFNTGSQTHNESDLIAEMKKDRKQTTNLLKKSNFENFCGIIFLWFERKAMIFENNLKLFESF